MFTLLGYDQPRQHIQKQRHYFANKDPSSQGYGFSSSHVWMWELDCEESWAPKNWCFWTVVSLRVPWTARRSKQCILKEISPGCSLEGMMLKLKLQYSCLVTRSWTWLRDFTFTFHFHPLKKEMATHSSVLAWRIPGMGKPGGLPSMGSNTTEVT